MQLDRRSALAVFLAASVITVVMTWPLAAHLGTMVPSDVGDPVLNTWILWWNAQQIPLTEAWWNAPIFHPATGTVAFSEHLLGVTPISSPIIWLTGNPQLAYNVTFLLTFVLSTTAAYVLAFELTGRHDAAFLGGLAFGFAPYRIAHFSHLQILASFWMPIALLGLHRFIRDGRVRWLALFGVAWLMQALSNFYYMAYFSVLVALWVLWFVRPRDWRHAVLIGVAWLMALVPLLPILLTYREVHALYGLEWQLDTIRRLSADVASVVNASPLLSLWGHLRVFPKPEGDLFTGFTVVAIVAISICVLVWRRRSHAARADASPRSAFVFYILATLAMFLLALGPSPTWMGRTIVDSGPYAWLMELPGLSSMRVPARFGMLMALCLSMAATLAFATLASASASTGASPSASPVNARRLRWVTVGLALAILSESWIGAMPLWDPPRHWNIRRSDVSGALLVLPMLNSMNEAAAMYRAMPHGRPLVNGYSGHAPPWYRSLALGLNNYDPAVLEVLAASGVTHIAVVLRNDVDGAWRRYAATRAHPVNVSTDSPFALYALNPVTIADLPTRVVPIQSVTVSSHPEVAAAMLDANLTTRWFTNTIQQGGEDVTIDLGSVQAVSAVEMKLGFFGFGHPRTLVVELSPDRSSWAEVWRGRGEAAAIAGAFRSPNEMPMVVPFGNHDARFIRMRLISPGEATWSIAELRVLTH